MVRWAIFFILVFAAGQLIAVSVEGGGFAVTRLSGNHTATVTTITVDSTINFLAANVTHPAYVLVDEEVCSYTGQTDTTFTGVTRGAADPQSGRRVAASAHDDDAKVKTLNVAALDSFMGYNITSSGAAFGFFDALKFTGRLFVNMPKFLLWDYPWFTGQLVVVRFVLFAFSGGFVFGMALALIGLAQSIFRL